MAVEMVELNPIIHQPVRLKIMCSLAALPLGDQVEFTYLKKVLKITDGNLGAHLGKLEQQQYIVIEKTFVNKKPKSFIGLTPKGKKAFEQHLEALNEVINPDV
jgi:DNA-binding MarR family transcriptional regulator